MPVSAHAPSYAEAVAYYLREDVTHLLWDLSRIRPLTFYYRSDVDLSSGEGRKAFFKGGSIVPVRNIGDASGAAPNGDGAIPTPNLFSYLLDALAPA